MDPRLEGGHNRRAEDVASSHTGAAAPGSRTRVRGVVGGGGGGCCRGGPEHKNNGFNDIVREPSALRIGCMLPWGGEGDPCSKLTALRIR